MVRKVTIIYCGCPQKSSKLHEQYGYHVNLYEHKEGCPAEENKGYYLVEDE